MQRPQPPEHLIEPGFSIEPALEVSNWLRATFIDEGSRLLNPDHEHLRQADIASMWTNVEYLDGLMPVVGTAELVRLNGKPWPRARAFDQLCLLFGRIPDFILTFYAPHAVKADDATWCATVEHELYHCAQKIDKENLPKFDPEGKPVWTIRPHDVEEFVGVMRRYGVEACAGKSKEFVEAAKAPPLIARAEIKGACGTCYAAI